jgi:hypothetical protein
LGVPGEPGLYSKALFEKKKKRNNYSLTTDECPQIANDKSHKPKIQGLATI